LLGVAREQETGGDDGGHADSDARGNDMKRRHRDQTGSTARGLARLVDTLQSMADDGVHLDEAAHSTLAGCLAARIREMDQPVRIEV